MMKIYSISLGCPKNRVDTEKTLGGLQSALGVQLVETPDKADVVFINTCGFIAPAVQESVDSILECAHEISFISEKKRPILAVAGCLVGRYTPRQLAPELPEVDILLDSHDVSNWAGIILKAFLERAKNKKAAGSIDPASRMLSTGPSYAWLKISEGCRHACSFCTIPSIRGGLKSSPADILVEEARRLVESGVKEINLVAQDVTAWGGDLADKKDLRVLLEPLLDLSGLERLRLMYLYPSGLNKDLLSFLKEAGRPFVPYFDIPMQHAAPDVLSRMGRPFAGDPNKIIDRVRGFFPDAALRTSIITGFPGETDKDFDILCDFIAEARFMHLGVFAYEAEEGTPAAEMPNQVPDKLKQERRDEIMRIQAEISEELMEAFTGQRMDILVDSPNGEWPGLFNGRAWFQAPDIDGITYISGPGVEAGALVQADIVESSTYDLVALV